MTRKHRLEHHRQGYPRLTAFLNLDPNFTIFKRFDNLHVRVLLEQQDRLAELEHQLEQCDDTEVVSLNLSSRRQDCNPVRRELLRQVKAELEDYDQSVLRFQQMLALPKASTRHRRSVYNWFNGNKPIVRSESRCFVDAIHDDDYVAVHGDDADRAGLEALFDHLVRAWPRLARTISRANSKTSDRKIFIFSHEKLRAFFQILTALAIPLGVISPAVLLYYIEGRRSRAVISAGFVFVASFAICFVTKTTKYNLLLAIVAYAAVLSAFLSDS
ncbi:hypothetical protein CC86DRAFT_464136 [Ophiobolus disseminans]|uniref:DUF6594 domain-containing protein n=1 Tax=Ophiobolus disseminans TaxID=1469910 RepID=A0A6A7A8I1_9PLEO|nr:hypothetical protein CC86DRAFT_464136 [Ophiobolus disseminans]